MKKYNLPPTTCQVSKPSEKQVYFTLQQNSNKPKQRRHLLTLKSIKDTIYYALGTVANALQSLRKKGLIFYNKVTRSWQLKLEVVKTIDTYDNYIKFRFDIRRNSINQNIYLFGYFDSKRILGGNL